MELHPKLQERRVVPFWTLRDQHGREYNLAKQRGRTHLLLAVFSAEADPRSFLEELASHAATWRQFPAQGVLVVPNVETAQALGAAPFTILIDEEERVCRQFLPDEAIVGVFLLDRYGELYHQWLVTDIADLPPADEINGWLEAISMQCSI
jgi:peroxiredoxin